MLYLIDILAWLIFYIFKPRFDQVSGQIPSNTI